MGLKDLKIIMKMKGISPEELSQKSGVPKSTIDKILSGNTPDPRYNTVKELVNALNLNVDELIYYLDLSADDISNSLTPQDISMAYKYHALDIHGKEIVSLLLQKEYERCSASQPCAKMIEMGTREIPSMVAEPVSPYMAGRIGSYESASTAQLDPGVSHEDKIKSLIDGSAPESSIIEMNDETGERKIEAIPLNESDLQEDPDSSLTIKGAERDINKVISETDPGSKKARAKTKA